jgi:hypothetical protein
MNIVLAPFTVQSDSPVSVRQVWRASSRLRAVPIHLNSTSVAGLFPGEEAAEELSDLMGWLALAQSAFDFWDNEEDSVYDSL